MIEVDIWGNRLVFETDKTLFSPDSPDRGTLAMLRHVELRSEDKLLDLGCGYGIVGVAAAKVIGVGNVFMVDNNPKAVEYSKQNAERNNVPEVTAVCGNGVAAFEKIDFTIILSNPPYHTDFSVAKAFIEDGFRHLTTGGRMIMVVKRLDWYRNKLSTVFGGVRVKEDDGYYILTSEKRLPVVKKKEKNKTTKKHLKKIMKSV